MVTTGSGRGREPWLQNQRSSGSGEKPGAPGQGGEEAERPRKAKSQTLSLCTALALTLVASLLQSHQGVRSNAPNHVLFFTKKSG